MEPKFPRWLGLKNLSAKQDTRVRSLCQEDPLEKEMATHSSILARKIPRTEEPGRGVCWVSKRVEHDLTTKQQQLKLLSFRFVPVTVYNIVTP